MDQTYDGGENGASPDTEASPKFQVKTRPRVPPPPSFPAPEFPRVAAPAHWGGQIGPDMREGLAALACGRGAARAGLGTVPSGVWTDVWIAAYTDARHKAVS